MEFLSKRWEIGVVLAKVGVASKFSCALLYQNPPSRNPAFATGTGWNVGVVGGRSSVVRTLAAQASYLGSIPGDFPVLFHIPSQPVYILKHLPYQQLLRCNCWLLIILHVRHNNSDYGTHFLLCTTLCHILQSASKESCVDDLTCCIERRGQLS